eukprot:COSAG02_NODE_1224_length_13785_cov_22.936285_6_plen_55_part_00
MRFKNPLADDDNEVKFTNPIESDEMFDRGPSSNFDDESRAESPDAQATYVPIPA